MGVGVRKFIVVLATGRDGFGKRKTGLGICNAGQVLGEGKITIEVGEGGRAIYKG